MKIDIVTIFPDLVRPLVQDGILARACERGLVDVAIHDLRDFTTDRHRVVDDTPFGGGPGMVMKPEPFFRAVAQVRAGRGEPDAVILPTPQGRRFTHAEAVRLSGLGHALVDPLVAATEENDVAEAVATEELSIGDYVLSGGELAAMVVVDAVARQLPGVVGDAGSVAEDSFARPWLDYPHYTRPAEWEGRRVPEVLLSGNHARIARWRLREALRRTRDRRPDLLERDTLTGEARQVWDELERERNGREHES